VNEEDETENQKTFHFLNKVVGHNIVELKTNHMSRGLLPLDKLFDSNDVSKKFSMKNQEQEVMECNIGTTANPKVVKISKALSEEKRHRYVILMKTNYNMFEWSYEDLNTFDTDIIEHKIPLKVGSNPFKKKIRQFNPMLMYIIEKELKIMLDAKINVPLRYSY
jgi:hypothetical protein